MNIMHQRTVKRQAYGNRFGTEYSTLVCSHPADLGWWGTYMCIKLARQHTLDEEMLSAWGIHNL